MRHEAIEHLIPGIELYAMGHIEPGGFLRAVLENDLRGACDRVDAGKLCAIVYAVAYMEERLPPECWGSPEKVKAWLAACGRRWEHD